MKSNLIALIIAVAALSAGYFFGCHRTSVRWQKSFNNCQDLAESKDISTFVLVLSSIHDGNQDKAMNLLEINLDGAIVNFGERNRIQEAKNDKMLSEAFVFAREYRSKHPWKSPVDQINKEVEDVLTSTQ